MRIENWRGFFVTVLTIATSSGFAAHLVRPEKEPAPTNFEKPWAWVATIGAGPIFENAGKTQTFYSAPEIEKTYNANRTSHTLVGGELFLGIQKSLKHQLAGQLGLAVTATDSANLSGNIWDDADLKFNNYTYNYKIRHSHVALKGKLIADKGFVFNPWLSGSLGVGFNQARDFSNTPKIFQAVVMPNFTNHTTTAFTYTVGAGVERNLNDHWRVGVGYEFTDWGKSGLSRAPGQTLNTGLAVSHVYTNGVLFNLTYKA